MVPRNVDSVYWQCTRERVGSHMDAAKLDHIQLIGAQLMWIRQHSVLSDLVSLQPTSDLQEPAATTARGSPLSTSTTDTGFVTQGSSGWGAQGVLTASPSSGLPVVSARIKPPLAAVSEPVLPRASQMEYERTIISLQQTIAEQTVRIAALEQKLGDPEELVARCVVCFN